MKPHRIQLSRKKGFRLPPNTVSVARPTKWGNPFVGDAAAAVEAFRQWWQGSCSVSVGPDEPIKRMAFIPAHERPSLASLRGKNLACWCKLDAPCHADVLLELANREARTDGD